MLAAVGLTTEVRTSDATDLLNRREASAAGFANGSAFLQQESKDIVAGFSLLRSADVFAQSRKMDRSFVGEEELSNHAQGSSEIVLATGRLDKGDILNAGISGRLLPCKTSRHSVDPRPVAVNIPVDELRTGSKKTLERLLSERRFEELPPNSVYEGRKYKERLLLLGRR